MAAVAVTIIDNQDLGARDENLVDESEGSKALIAGKTLDGIPKSLRPYFAKASFLPIVDKLNALVFEEITNDDVVRLIQALAPEPESGGKLHLSRLRRFLCSPILENSLNTEEADTLLADLMDNADEDTKMLSITDILACFKHSEGRRNFVHMRKIDNAPAELTRDVFVEHIRDVTDRNDAFITLPITVVYVGIFLYLVMGHLRIFDRQSLEKSMEEYVNGRDPRETADENVDDIDSWWDWVMVPGTRGPFGKVVNSSHGFHHCVMASRNILLGDVQIAYRNFDQNMESQWLLKSETGQAYLRDHPGKYMEAARAAATHYQNNGWSDKKIHYVYLRFNGYNEFERMFSMTEVWLPLKGSGHARTIINTDALSCQAYPIISLLVLDIVFLVLVLYIFVGETKEALSSLALGCGEFYDYLQFWNLVDWLNITLTIVIVLMWLLIVGAMSAQPIVDLIDDEYMLKTDVMKLSKTELDDLDVCLSKLRSLYLTTHFVMAFSTASVVLKFFKAFESNRRLRVVTDTFKRALDDLIHFFITFSTIYLPFCLIAHIMFGSDIVDFASISSSLNAGFVVLMGDFGWYVDTTAAMVIDSKLPSGMPVFCVLIWYWAYMFLMFLVLLNMLLAVVMEHYIRVVGELDQVFDKPTIWTQAHRWWIFFKETRKFKSLMNIRADLENDNAPAHPTEDVSAESLKEAWPEMKPEQVEWVMHWLQKYVDDKNATSMDKESQIQALSEHNRELAMENAKKIDELCKEVMGNKSRIDDMTSSAASVTPAEGIQKEVTADNYQQEMGVLNENLKELIASLGKVRKDQERLARRVEELAMVVPQDAKLMKIAGGGKKLDLSADAEPAAGGNEPTVSEPIAKNASKKEKKEKKAAKGA